MMLSVTVQPLICILTILSCMLSIHDFLWLIRTNWTNYSQIHFHACIKQMLLLAMMLCETHIVLVDTTENTTINT
jgi:hypothetical protein